MLKREAVMLTSTTMVLRYGRFIAGYERVMTS
jgi:hypothetical protein